LKWFKHDSDAAQDARLRKVIIKYGPTGYAIYFYCLELISGNVSDANITFELEHDAEIIADGLKVKGTNDQAAVDLVNEIMRYMVSLGLFESAGNKITCFKLAKRLDQSMTNSKQMRSLIADIKETKKGQVYILKSQYGYKIGKAKNYENRGQAFGIQLPFDFSLCRLYSSEDYSGHENELHKKYIGNRLNGEWFQLTMHDISDIDDFMAGQGCKILSCHDESCPVMIEETRRDYTILDNTRLEYTKPTMHEINEYQQDKCPSVDSNTFFEYYDSNDWQDKNGKPVKNWKLKMLTWHNKNVKSGWLPPVQPKKEYRPSDDPVYAEWLKLQEQREAQE
jgi:hypothetical protein